MRTKGFTLAEVLITLGIIGIVAAITLPILIQKHQEKVTVTKVKEAYSILSQAYFRASEANGGDISTWHCTSLPISKQGLCVMEEFEKFLKVTSSKKDKSDSVPYSLNMAQNDNAYYNNLQSITLENGFIIKFHFGEWSCNTYENWDVAEIEKFSCGIYVDINGEKEPNALGRDTFVFKIHKNTVSPYGNATEPYYKFPGLCSISRENDFWDGGVNGVACAGWIIASGNMDYLHCSDLSYKGKTKCK